MPGVLIAYVRIVERIGRWAGYAAMVLLFAMMGILLWSSISKTFFLPSHWTLSMAQFAMMAFFFLGGPYSMQMGSHVRMDLVYERLSTKGRAWMDALTAVALLVFLGLLLYGGMRSSAYSLEYGDTTRGLWRAPLWPIKLLLCTATVLMIAQALANLVRDIATIRGAPIPPSPASPRHDA